MEDTTVGRVVKEAVEILWQELQPIHMPLPTTESLKSNAKEFEKVWNFPHVVGCLDDKHIRIVCPTDSGAKFFNYKKYFSVVLQGLVDANYKFITVDVGGFGKQSDGGTFLASDLLMKPYERNSLTGRRRNFNERLSRARKTVECAFGILYSKWRIISKATETAVELADKIVKCICVLHNTIIDKEGVDRHLTDVTVQSKCVAWERRGRLPTEAKNIRDLFALYMEEYPSRYN